MDYLGESGIGAWSYGTPEQASQAAQITGAIMNTGTIDKMFLGMANGVDMAAMMSQGTKDPVMQAVMAVLFHDYPWHAAVCGDIDLTGYRKPQSYYRDIIWNGGDRIYATVRLPEPPGKKIIATMWATYPTLPTWTWPGQDHKNMQVEVYSGAEKVQLFLNGKLLGEQPTGPEQEFKATFSVPYTPGTLKAVGLRNNLPVAESVLTTAGMATNLRLTPDRTVIGADGQDLSFVTVEAVDTLGRLQPQADQEVQFSIGGPGVIAAVGNGDGQDPASYQGDQRKLYQGRALVVIRASKQPGQITVTAKAQGLTNGIGTIQAQAVEPRAELP
jgi:beta-galactosidase